jgi:hypothetical protein
VETKDWLNSTAEAKSGASAPATGATPFAQLQHILDRLIIVYRTLNDILREEYAHMSQLDVKGMAEAAHAKEVLLGEVMNLEQLRLTCSEQLAKSVGLDPQKVTILMLSEKLPKPQSDILKNARTVLMLLVNQSKELNAKNSVFAESSLGRIAEMKKNVLGLNNNNTKDNYSANGSRQTQTEQGGRLLSTEA